jgi:phosphoribosylanthranilate isomerase
MRHTWIKICGLKDPAAAEVAAGAGTDAIGVNFYSPSPRFVGSIENAREVVAAAGPNVLTVGVFVNHPLAEIVHAVEEAGLDAVQLHGNETIESLAELRKSLPKIELIWARRVQGDDLAQVVRDIDACTAHGIKLFATLIDPKVDGQFGGTGVSLTPDAALRQFFAADSTRILAGGLTPDSVPGALAALHPWGVDVAGGVESSRGVKDPDRIREFIEAVRLFDGRSSTEGA